MRWCKSTALLLIRSSSYIYHYGFMRIMQRLLGLGKTDAYWLVKKKYFETIVIAGKMRIIVDSFEKWYDNQLHYHKVTLINTNDQAQIASVEMPQVDIKNLIYVIRNQQVMIDSDLAVLYQVETGRLNEAVKRNISRFPERFRFQLTKEEYVNLKSQSAISSLNRNGNTYGGRRTLPYAFTEQGIAMLSTVLRSEIAIQTSIRIMDTFVEMRRFIANNALLFERISNVELKQLEYQKQTDEKLEQIFEYISEHEEASQKVFFDGQIYDAFSLIVSLMQKAEKEITLIDGYVDVGTLNLLSVLLRMDGSHSR